jgi:hypothetical protein
MQDGELAAIAVVRSSLQGCPVDETKVLESRYCASPRPNSQRGMNAAIL